jgi:hypothetical protein
MEELIITGTLSKWLEIYGVLCLWCLTSTELNLLRSRATKFLEAKLQEIYYYLFVEWGLLEE